uniref:Uncharacterized protein n=1 Tax=Panagrolaimus superbus TaxID=310955 RepID=A0A914YAC0_9BILA
MSLKKNETEDPIAKLAVKIGYNSTVDMLHGEFRDCVKFIGQNIIEATPKLYDTPELQHIISLQKRTVNPFLSVRKRNRTAEKITTHRPRILYGNENAAGIHRPIERFEVRRPMHIYGDINEVRNRRRIIQNDNRKSERIYMKKINPSTFKHSTRRHRINTFNLDCRKTDKTDLLDRVLDLTKNYGFQKRGGRLTSLHLTTLSCPGIADWRFMLKDVLPKQFFFDELCSNYCIKNKRGETYFDKESQQLYSVWSGRIKTRKYKILFLIDC